MCSTSLQAFKELNLSYFELGPRWNLLIFVINIIQHWSYSLSKSIMEAPPLAVGACNDWMPHFGYVPFGFLGPVSVSSCLPRPLPAPCMTKQLNISVCLQLIAAQPQLIACYACTMPDRVWAWLWAWGVGCGVWGWQCCLPLAIYSLEAYQLQTGSRCSVTPFVCLRFQLSLDVLWLSYVHMCVCDHAHFAHFARFDAVICVNALVKCARLYLLMFDRQLMAGDLRLASCYSKPAVLRIRRLGQALANYNNLL